MDGKWQGDSAPEFTVSLQGKNVSRLKAELKSKPKRYELSVPIPSEAIAKGVHTVIISLVGSSDALAKIPIVAGDVLSEDIRAEVSLLREELDLLKRAFRRHLFDDVSFLYCVSGDKPKRRYINRVSLLWET